MKKAFVGIDFSKLTFDSAIFHLGTNSIISNEVFENAQSGYEAFLEWVLSNTHSTPKELFFCGEHTGYYSTNFSNYVQSKGYDLWLVSGLQIKLSQGIKRTKNDKIDACYIAEYAYRHHDKAQLYQPLSATLDQIRDLLSYRERLVNTRKILTISSKELSRIKENHSTNLIITESIEYIHSMSKSIRALETQIEKLISENSSLDTNYKILNSIIGIGFVNASYILVATSNFSIITNPRKFGCYCGVVPFEFRSGTSIHGKNRVSKLANQQLKTKLSLAAQNSIRYDPQIKAYYLRKISEGKHHCLVLNNVKNKLIHRMFALIRDGKLYDQNYKHPLMSSGPAASKPKSTSKNK